MGQDLGRDASNKFSPEFSSEASANKESSVENSADSANAAPGFAYRGPVSGLKGLLTTKLAEGIASVVSTIDKVTDLGSSMKREAGTQPIAIEKIYPCPDQPRQVFEPKSLEDLSQTMKELGQAQAITVRPTAKGYEIISGERRYRAAKLAGLTHLDCVVKEVTPTEGRLLALVENIQRQDLLPIEEAQFLKKVLEENPDMSLEKLAKLLGSHKSTLSEKIQLTEVPEDLQQHLYAKGRNFTHRHWRVLSRIDDASSLRSMTLQALEHQLSVAELERSLAALGIKKALRRKKSEDSFSLQTSFEKFNLVRRDGETYRLRAMTFVPAKLTHDARARLISELESLLLELRGSSSINAMHHGGESSDL
jgi:ParB family chromosome partitioning protein